MRYLILIGILFAAGTTVLAGDFYPQKNAVTQIQKTLKTKEVEITGSFNLSSELVDGRMIVYDFKYDARQDINYAVFTESMGRHELFEYLIICDSVGKIQLVKILKYRSEHGGEIASKKWLSQFEDFSDGNLQYGTDISAISGATISAKSITKDVPVIIQLLKNHLNVKNNNDNL